jgi:hypothetical protein
MKEFLLFLAFSLGFGILIFKKLSQYNLFDRYIAATIPAATFIFFVSVLNKIIVAPFFAWNAIRLAPTFALTHGYQLYYGADTGPILSTIYGPILYLAYLPATLGISPNGAIIIGTLISVAFFFIPILFLFVSESFHQSQKAMNLNRSQKLLFIIYAFYVFIGFFVFSCKSLPLDHSAFVIHADAIALGFGGAACCVLYFRKRKDSLLSLLLSAIMIVLAIWTKQVTLPLLIALPTYVLLADGLHCFKRYLSCICISGLIISAFLLIIFNPELVFFNIFTIPGNHPWRIPGTLSDTEVVTLVANNKQVASDKISALVVASKELIQYCWVPVLVIFLASLYQFLFLSSPSKTISEWLSYNRWSMLLIVSLFMIPTSLLNRVKVGGALNGFCFTLYFLAAAAILLLFRLILDSLSINSASSKSFNLSKFLILVLVTTFFFNNIPANALKELNTTLQKLPNNPRQVEYNYAKLHPGEVYFPWNPLSSLMAEGKLYHHEFALEDRLLAGYSVSTEHFRSYIPSNINKVAFLERNDGYVMKLLPEFSKKVEDNDFPGWTVYTQE